MQEKYLIRKIADYLDYFPSLKVQVATRIDYFLNSQCIIKVIKEYAHIL